jgi:hypothetical protein
VDKYMILQKALDEISEQDSVTHLLLDEYEKQTLALYSLFPRPSSIDCLLLRKFLEQPQHFKNVESETLEDLQRAVGCLFQTMGQLSRYHVLCEGPRSSINLKFTEIRQRIQYSKDEKKDEEEDIDLSTVLFPGFWNLVREGTLPYLGISPHSALGITHAGQLTLFGILDNQDLHLLGISHDLQTRVDSLMSEIGALQGVKRLKIEEADGFQINRRKELEGSFVTLWQEFIDIKSENDQLRSMAERLLQILNLNQLDQNDLRKSCIAICQQLLNFKHLSKEARINLVKRMKTLDACQQSPTIRMIASRILKEGMMILRSQYPLICLQRYLVDNINLKQAWEISRRKGCRSIRDLFEKGFVKEPADLLRLYTQVI